MLKKLYNKTIDLRNDGLERLPISLEEFIQYRYCILYHATSSTLASNIKKEGLLPPRITNTYSNKDLFRDGDEDYIYLSSKIDPVYAQNAVSLHGGLPVVLSVRIEIRKLELDDIMCYFSRRGIALDSIDSVFNELVCGGNRNSRTKKEVPPKFVIDELFI